MGPTHLYLCSKAGGVLTVWLTQLITSSGERVVAARENAIVRRLKGEATVYTLARRAIREQRPLAELIAALGLGEVIDLDAAEREGRLLSPIDHPDPAHLFITGTGLTHLGSAAARDAMHAATAQAGATETDSMRMFNMGLEGGRPARGEAGAQPEWFYKGNGNSLAAPGASLAMPDYSGDGGEEPELAGVYIVSDEGTPFRVGFALANEFSDHVTERVNYLWLAHSKLRPAAIGPELRLGDLPPSITGTSRIRRGDSVIWEKPFASGEANMSHTIANLEHHHFKYPVFRQPGDVHVHMFGTATLSYADGIRALPGDVFEIEASDFGRPLRNPLAVEPSSYSAARSV
ncbi:MAG: AraD1 family protein [Cucumibacter sp.]